MPQLSTASSNRNTQTAQKVCLCITEDWFALSHFKPLIAFLVGRFQDVVVITNCSEKGRGQLRDMGVRVVALDFERFSLNPVRQIVLARKLARIFTSEQPDFVHLVALKPILIGGIAAKLAAVPAMVVHVTGLGHLAIAQDRKTRLARSASFRLLNALMRTERHWLLVENPDDLEFLQRCGVGKSDRTTMLGGAGVNLQEFPFVAEADNPVPVAACVGRMIRQKGFDIAVQAHALLQKRGVPFRLALYGRTEQAKKDGFSVAEIETLTRDPNVSWSGHVDNVTEVWSRANIALFPSRCREGMPKAMLEAAACGRAVIVTDIPGPRHFVSDNENGLLIPEDDPLALANAIECLLKDPELRLRLGRNARKTIEERFAEEHLQASYADVYKALVTETVS